MEPVTVGEWFWILLFLSIPVLNIILIIVWSMGISANQSLVNFSQAILLWFVVGFLLVILFGIFR